MKLLKVNTVEQALEKLLESAQCLESVREHIALELACDRILGEDLYAGDNIPAFRRSTVDGYAVVSGDTAAAGESIPVFLTIKGQINMGEAAGFSISSGECAEVPTGGMLPDGADAVVMVEYSEPFGNDGVALYHIVANGENVVQIGEDTKTGSLLLPRGRKLRPQDIGTLAAAGISKVTVYRPLRLTILSTGDELVQPADTPLLGQVRDINTQALRALAERNGYLVVRTGVIRDDTDELKQAVLQAMADSDLVAVSGGSSQGKKDATREVFDSVSAPGVFTHGLAVKPGKPTILGLDQASGTLLIGLPGHPVSAMMVFELLLGRLFRELTDCLPPPAIPAVLTCNIASAAGKLTCLPVSLTWNGTIYEAAPIFGKSGLITTLTRADGYCIIDRSLEGLQTGETVLVHLF